MIQQDLLDRSRKFREENTFVIDDYTQFRNHIEDPGGFLNAHWCGSAKCELKIKEDTKATIRVIPFDQDKQSGKCILCNEDSKGRVIFAKAY